MMRREVDALSLVLLLRKGTRRRARGRGEEGDKGKYSGQCVGPEVLLGELVQR